MLEIALKRELPTFTLDASLNAPGGVTVLFGPSGAGKSSVAQGVAGLTRMDAARVVVDGVALHDLPPHRRRIGYVFQEPRLFPHLSVAGNLRFGASKGADIAPVADLLDIAPLLRRRPAHLSGGEASRVALGRALLSNPRLLILDEPLSALDAARKADILPYLERLRDHGGVPMLYITHALEEVQRLGTTLALMSKGKVTRVGPVAQILSDPAAALDLGPRQAGAVLSGTVADHADGLTRLDTPAGTLWLPGTRPARGTQLHVRVMAQDVILATTEPTGLSALNILKVRVTAITPGTGPGAIVTLDAGGAPLLARVTKRSAAAMDLAPGQTVWAVIKTVATAPEAITP